MIERRVGAIEPGSIRLVLPNYPHSVTYPEDTEAIEVVSLPH